MSNVLQERVKKTDVLGSFATDHSPILLPLYQMRELSHEKGLFKFNKSLLYKEYVEKESAKWRACVLTCFACFTCSRALACLRAWRVS